MGNVLDAISIPEHLDQGQLGEFRHEFFKALGDPVRLVLVAYLAQLGEPSTVTKLSSCCGIDFSGVSRHLKILRDAEIVSATKQGRETYYKLNSSQVSTTLRTLSEILDKLES